ncbi:WYL domain-containing protein [Rothia mucilaginosa]|uniref:helix-turn-helix transcriptional regulator n=1 Tax=Rothia mucilaginosa TaxID=43675 RepID=UPI0028ECC8DE|nr:WYL domain-containing protein [Rothia mucilaginosa]
MSTAAQLYMTLHRLATAAEAPDAATRTQGISRNELLTLLGISTRANGSLSESQERAFERAKQTLRDAGARITHVTTDLGERYRLEPSDAAKLPAWNPTAEEFRLINTILRGWEGTELQDDAYRILRKIALTSDNLTDEALAAAKILEPKTGKRQRAKNLYSYREPLQRIYFSDNPHLNELFTAYAERKTVTFTYQTAAGATRTQEKVSVAGIGYRYGTWYFVGYYTESSERKEYTFRASRIQKLTMLSRIDSTPINATFNAKNWLEDIRGYEESLTVAEVNADSTLSAPFTVPSYGTIDSAVAATSYSCVIEPPEELDSEATTDASTRQRDSYAAQRQLLRTLTDLHSGVVEDPGTWSKIDQRNRNNVLDALVDLILGLHRADRWASTHGEEPMPLNQLNALYSVDTEKNRDLGKTIIPEIFARVDTVPFDADPKDPDALKPTYINLLPDFGGATPNTLLNYARLTDTELAILVFTLSAADILHPADARLGSIREALAAAYPNAPVYAQHLCFAPEEPLLQEATAALSSGNAVTIGYGTSERAADRLVDPYALVLHRDHMYLHAWCRTAEERYYAARGEEVPEYVPEAFAHAATGEAGNNETADSAATDSEAGEKTPTFWRNFRLTRINHIREAGEGRTHPVTGDTVPHWHAKQHSTQTNPFAELRIHPTEHIPSGEPLDTLTATYMRRSTHHVKKASRTQYVRIHYYNNAHGAGDKNILDTVIAHRGALELVGPAHLRAALLEQLQTLNASSRRGTPAEK